MKNLICTMIITVLIPISGISGIINNFIKIDDQEIETQIDYFYGYENVEEYRKDIVNTAVEYKDKINYKFGSKPDRDSWEIENNELDCSGFTEYIYHKATGVDIGQSTFNQSTDLINKELGESIKYSDLLPGDLGFIYNGEDTLIRNNKGMLIDTLENHVGIYIGKNNIGEDLWVHCNSKDGTVVINSPDYFKFFVRINR